MRAKSRLNRVKQPPVALIQGNIDTLTQGISQQPQHLRQVGQGTKQVNGWSSPVDGLGKRRPTQFVGRIAASAVTDFFLETMPVTAGERYNLFLYNTAGKSRLQILLNSTTCSVDVHGTGLSAVTTGSVKEVEGTSSSYLYNAADLLKSYVFINNGPFGLLLNREKVTAMKAATSASQPYEALIFIQGVNYEITYTVTLDGTALPVYTTPKATDTNNLISTDKTAEELTNRINNVSGFTATRSGSVVYVRRSNNADFTIQLDDSRANSLGTVIKGSVTSFSQLPLTGKRDFIVKVESDPGTTDDDIWVKFTPRDANATYGSGGWQECVAPGIKYSIDEQTMPLVIYRAASGVFFVGPADGATRSQTVSGVTYSYTFPKWGDRAAGDETTVPTPTFIGKKIRDHNLFRSRYAVIGGESVVLSEVDDIFNFFNDTAAQVLETDPIDLRAVSETSIDLTWMLPIDETLLVFSQKSQFQVRPADADVLTPRTAICLRLSNIEMNSNVRPRIAGPNVVFATDEYGYTGFREYQFFDTQQKRLGLNLGGSLNITSNTPKYIKQLATFWDVGENLDYFVCSSPEDRKQLFVYKYLWQVATGVVAKQQSSWSTWTFDGDVRWVRFYDNKLWLVMTYPDGTYLASLEAEELDSVSSPAVYLDRLLLYPECNGNVGTADDITAAYNAVTNTTTFTLPYQIQSTTDVVIRYDNNRNRALVVGTATSGNQIVCGVKGDWRTDKLAIGARYKFEYEFTQAFVPQKDQSRSRIIGGLDGRLQVATWTIHHFNSGRYDVIVRRKNRSINSQHEYWARTIDVGNNTLDTATTVLDTGVFRVPVHSKNTDCTISVESETWLPLKLSGASWEGSYSDRAKGVG
jgi:hypothetical protein